MQSTRPYEYKDMLDMSLEIMFLTHFIQTHVRYQPDYLYHLRYYLDLTAMNELVDKKRDT